MTDQPSSQGQPDDWGRAGYFPGEQYADEQYYGAGSSGSSRSGPAMGAAGYAASGQGGLGYGASGQGGLGYGASGHGDLGYGASGQEAARPGPSMPTASTWQAAPGQDGLGLSAPPPAGSPSMADTRGFLSALFDFGFTSFVTTRIVKVLYVLILIMVCISALVYTIIAFRISSGFGLLTLLIGDPLFIIIVMALWRVILESFVVRFRIAEDVRALRERDGR